MRRTLSTFRIFVVMDYALDVSVCLEANTVSSNKAPKLWGMVSLTENRPISETLSVDVIVGLNISSSMRDDDKFEHSKRAIQSILERLDEKHTFSLVAYNHGVEYLFPFMNCTPQNKELVSTLLNNIMPFGSTDIIGALKEIISTIDRHPNRNQLTAVFLITDGVDMSSFNYRQIPPIKNCMFNILGIGLDANSKLLYGVSRHVQGTYHFVEDPSSISIVMNECMTNILDVRFRDVCVSIECHDGCRLIAWMTEYPYIEEQPSKKYTFKIGNICSSETITSMFWFSLRQLGAFYCFHPLARILATYTLPDGSRPTTSSSISVLRLVNANIDKKMPDILQYHMDKTLAYTAILKSIQESDIQRSNKILEDAAKNVSQKSMIADLELCKNQTSKRIHVVCSLASSYITGRCLSLKRRLLATPEICYTNYVDLNEQ